MLLTANAVYVGNLPDILVHESGGMEPHLLFDLASNILSFHEELLQATCMDQQQRGTMAVDQDECPYERNTFKVILQFHNG
jgi:hypothetical protein